MENVKIKSPWTIKISDPKLHNNLLILKILNKNKTLEDLVRDMVEVFQKKRAIVIPEFIKDLKEIEYLAHPGFTKNVLEKWQKKLEDSK